MTDSRVRDALASVSEDYYTRAEDGGLIRQSSSVEAITAMLERLDVHPGMRVLEIGTGSGFSGALLGELVGESGSVVSMDVVPDLVERAKGLHSRRGVGNIRVVTGDGVAGMPEQAPYDRLVAWAAGDRLHRTWADQCVTDAVLVVPITLAAVLRADAIVRARRTREGGLEADRLWSGGYVEMYPEELTQWLVPPRGVQAQATDAEGNPWWISGTWIDEGDRHVAQRLVETLAFEARVEGELLASGESCEDFRTYLYATASVGLSMIGLGARGWAPGHATAESAAVVLGDGGLLTAGGPESALELKRRAEEWRSSGRPGAGSLIPTLEEVRDGWFVRSRGMRRPVAEA
ncbi:protein-L-isoaspartate O-methyltransferase [Nocardiopsis alba]|uniref:protein-L-isoaspartate O-methyltransferase family protein n=1 Tax=Nocardiopsis alba TaxID=53437 RepID=UPI003668BBE7